MWEQGHLGTVDDNCPRGDGTSHCSPDNVQHGRPADGHHVSGAADKRTRNTDPGAASKARGATL